MWLHYPLPFLAGGAPERASSQIESSGLPACDSDTEYRDRYTIFDTG